MSLSDRISLQPTALDVRRLNEWLDQKFLESGVDKALAADLKLCLNEIVGNLISYGFKDTSDPLTLVQITLDGCSASATVTDNGGYFDVREWKAPQHRDLMTSEPGGFGINLIKERAKHIEYARVGALNQLKIVCKVASPESGLRRK